VLSPAGIAEPVSSPVAFSFPEEKDKINYLLEGSTRQPIWLPRYAQELFGRLLFYIVAAKWYQQCCIRTFQHSQAPFRAVVCHGLERYWYEWT